MSSHRASTILDEEMFYAIVPDADRRASPRRAAGLMVSICRIIGGIACDRLNVMLMDVSSSGIAMRSPVPLDREGIYRIELGAGDSVRVQINRSRRRVDGTYDVGARFAWT